ncbi:MAG: GtrA family protein [Candidatus Faecivicinus sp.]
MKIALIVPAYKPTEDMIPMLERFSRETDFVPVVVNDGSGEAFEKVFACVPEGTVLLRHEVNRGKGAALKTAMSYILEKLPECDLAVTADADGQHRYEDIVNVARIAGERHGTLVLGSRAFDGDIPLRSRLGNAITRQVFAAASGTPVRDTQTGLRAFDREAMRKFVDIPGERYEYEINMLLYAAQNDIPIIEETIETVYINDNSSSHFNPFRDSLKIYMCIFKYIASSLVGFGVDFFGLLLFKWITAGLGAERSLLVSVVLARVVSAAVNFAINKTVVFHSKGDWKRELGKYAVLAVCILIVNYYLLRLLTITLHWPLVPAKLLVEVVLFCVNFLVQGRIVYRRKNKA